jgi:hypothetical protein
MKNGYLYQYRRLFTLKEGGVIPFQRLNSVPTVGTTRILAPEFVQDTQKACQGATKR